MFTLYDTGPGTILDEKPGMFAPAIVGLMY
jgi:hypothetical protein